MKPWAEAFYKSDTWRETSKQYIASVGGMCERCSTDIDPIPAKICHHRIYLTPRNVNDFDIALCWDNLEALCQTCHNREHNGGKERRYAFDEDGNVIPPLSKIEIPQSLRPRP